MTYILAGVLDVQFFGGDVVEQFVVFALFNTAERVYTAGF